MIHLSHTPIYEKRKWHPWGTIFGVWFETFPLKGIILRVSWKSKKYVRMNFLMRTAGLILTNNWYGQLEPAYYHCVLWSKWWKYGIRFL